MACFWNLAEKLPRDILGSSTMRLLLTTAACNLFQSLNSLMSWYAILYLKLENNSHFLSC